MNIKSQYGFSDLPTEGVPVLLPWDASCNHNVYKFRIIVNTKEEAEALLQIIQPKAHSSSIIGMYFGRLPETNIISLEDTRRILKEQGIGSIRFEDL